MRQHRTPSFYPSLQRDMKRTGSSNLRATTQGRSRRPRGSWPPKTGHEPNYDWTMVIFSLVRMDTGRWGNERKLKEYIAPNLSGFSKARSQFRWWLSYRTFLIGPLSNGWQQDEDEPLLKNGDVYAQRKNQTENRQIARLLRKIGSIQNWWICDIWKTDVL